MTMPHTTIESTSVQLHPTTLNRLKSELEETLRFHEERLIESPEPDDISMAVYHRSETARDEVQAALSRMVANTYGMCESCGQPISEVRLEAMPHTRHCMSCAHQAGHRK